MHKDHTHDISLPVHQDFDTLVTQQVFSTLLLHINHTAIWLKCRSFFRESAESLRFVTSPRGDPEMVGPGTTI